MSAPHVGRDLERVDARLKVTGKADYAAEVGVPGIAPHDLRRTCAKLCRAAGGELEQIQLLLGHASVQTTERYLGCEQKLRIAVNDRLGIEPDAA